MNNLLRAKQLILRNQFDLALEIVKQQPPTHRFEATIVKSMICHYQGNLELCGDILKDLQKEIDVIHLPNMEFPLRTLLARNYQKIGNLQNAIKEIERASHLQSYYFTDFIPGKSDLDLNYPALSWFSFYYYVQGSICNASGQNKEAMKFYESSLTVEENMTDKLFYSSVLNNIGEIFRIRGDLKKAKKYYEKSLFHNYNEDSLRGQAVCYVNLGLIAFKNNELKLATRYLENAQVIFHNLDNPIDTAEGIYYLLLVLFGQLPNSHIEERIVVLKKRLKRLKKNTKNRRVNLFYQLARVYQLRLKQRLKTTARAQDILEKILEDDIIDLELHFIAMVNLCGILLEELTLYNRNETMDDIMAITSNLYQLAQNQGLIVLIIESMIIQAKLSVLNQKVSVAHIYLEQAIIIAKENGLTKLEQKVDEELKFLEMKLDDAEGMIKDGSQLKESMEYKRLSDYLETISKLID